MFSGVHTTMTAKPMGAAKEVQQDMREIPGRLNQGLCSGLNIATSWHSLFICKRANGVTSCITWPIACSTCVTFRCKHGAFVGTIWSSRTSLEWRGTGVGDGDTRTFTVKTLNDICYTYTWACIAARDGSVGIATAWGLYDRGSVPNRGKTLFSTPLGQGRLWGLSSLLYNGLYGFSPRG